MPSEKKLERELRREIKLLKLKDPEAAKEYEEALFNDPDTDRIVMEEPDLSEVKFYPGSDKGPAPEDDIENYSKWFVENQPPSIYGGKPT